MLAPVGGQEPIALAEGLDVRLSAVAAAAAGRGRRGPSRPGPAAVAVALVGPLVRRDLTLAVAAFFLKSLLTVASPLAILALLRWYQDTEAPLWHGHLFAAANGVSVFGQQVLQRFFTIRGARVGQCCQVAAAGVLFRRTLDLTTAELGRFKTGELINLLSADAENLADFWTGVITLAFQPVEIMAIIFLLWWVVAEATLGVLALSGISYACINALGRAISRRNALKSALADERLKMLAEVLWGIKVVKANGWGPRFERQISSVAQKESVHGLWKKRYMGQVVFFSNEIVDITAFTACVLSILACGHEPDASRLFTTYVIMAVLHSKLFAFPEAVRKVSTAWTSLRRCSFFLNATARENNMGARTEESTDETGLSVSGASFAFFETNESVVSLARRDSAGAVLLTKVLTNVSLELMKGRFYAVVGTVGAGKTSLLLGLLGEMHNTSGQTGRSRTAAGSTFAYVPQDPIIFNDTFRENVCFGMPFDPEWYKKVCSSCALDHDLSLLQDGDASTIGSRGINISGGQQARISLARAVYSRANIFLLDDPLAKLDLRVSSAVFSDVVLGLLEGHTRIMVANNLSVLGEADAVIRVTDGTAKMEQSDESAKIAELCADVNDANDVRCTSYDETANLIPVLPTSSDGDEEALFANLFGVSDRISHQKAAGSLSAVRFYLHHVAAGMGSAANASIYGSFIIAQVIAIEMGVWILAKWADDPSETRHSHAWYASCYAASLGADIVIAQGKFLALAEFTQSSCHWLHEALILRVLGSSLLWIQGVPTGQLLQLFSKSLGRIEDRVFHATELLILNFSFLLVMNFIIGIFMPLVLAGQLSLLFVSALLVMKAGRGGGGAIGDEASLHRSCFQHYTETLGGLVLVRTFAGAAGRFLGRFDALLGRRAAAQAASSGAEASLLMRVGLVGSISYVGACFAAVALRGGTDLSPGDLGFVLTNCCFFSFTLTECVSNSLILLDIAKDREVIERLVRGVPQEERTGGDATTSGGPGDPQPPPCWPSCGQVSIEHMEVRYRADWPAVVQDFSLEINGGEHLGIVGRTGCGKSSLLLAICRLVEPCAGQVSIDGVNVARIPLQELRPHLGILSQDPLFFSGSLRRNLDPFGLHQDVLLLSALEDVGLAELFTEKDADTAVAQSPQVRRGLDTVVAELGSNFSAGQRQLLCLARAALRKPKVVLVDEATAALDAEADACVQRVLESRFSAQGATVLQVAHRLCSVATCARIAVLVDGRLAELVDPAALLCGDPGGGGLLQEMASRLGQEEALVFRRALQAAVQQRHRGGGLTPSLC